MSGFELLATNLASPIVLAFVLGLIAGFAKSEIELPEAVLKLISIYLLFSIGLKGGSELREVEWSSIWGVLAVTVGLIVAIPVICFMVLRGIGRFDAANAAAVAAHYGSVSSVTFLAALNFAEAMRTPAEGYLPAIVALMEWGVIVALLLARMSKNRSLNLDGAQNDDGLRAVLIDTLRGRGILLLTGGIIIGMLTTERTWGQIAPFYDGIFRGVLMLFLIEMGMTAARQMHGFAKVGWFMAGFGTVMPVIFGVATVTLGQWAGMSLGGAFVLGAIAASASYIDAPAAVRASIPEANPGIYLTSSLGITFPFNLLVGLPIYYAYATWLYR
jgi:hypothetical protein